VLAAATTTSGRSESRGAPQPPREAPTTVTTVSGAAFNCGRECTIVQANQALTVETALLGSDVTKVPPVTFRLDDQKRFVDDSFNPGRELTVTAKRNGDTIEIVTVPRFSQKVSVESGQLVVVTSVMAVAGDKVTFRYTRKVAIPRFIPD
jgi:hypothetical protein